MKKYSVGFNVEARYNPQVEAESPSDAFAKAETSFEEADFGEAFDIDSEALFAEGEKSGEIFKSDGELPGLLPDIYDVRLRIKARYVAKVEAETASDAIRFGWDAFAEADFGAACAIEGELRFVEDEEGNRVLDYTEEDGSDE